MRCCLAPVIYHAASQRRPSHWRSSPTPCTPRQRHTDLVLAAVIVDHQLAAERVNAVQFSRRAFVQRPSERAAATRISARSGSNDLVVILDLAVAIGTTTCTAQVPLVYIIWIRAGARETQADWALLCPLLRFKSAVEARRRRRVVLEQFKAMPGVTLAPAMGPKPFQRGLPGCGPLGSAETTTVLHPRQFFHQSVSRMSRVDIRPHQSRTRRDTVNHRLTRSQLPIQLAQYRAAAGACSESVASP